MSHYLPNHKVNQDVVYDKISNLISPPIWVFLTSFKLKDSKLARNCMIDKVGCTNMLCLYKRKTNLTPILQAFWLLTYLFHYETNRHWFANINIFMRWWILILSCVNITTFFLNFTAFFKIHTFDCNSIQFTSFYQMPGNGLIIGAHKLLIKLLAVVAYGSWLFSINLNFWITSWMCGSNGVKIR